VRKLIILFLLAASVTGVQAQDSSRTKMSDKKARREQRKEKVNAMIRQEEEGIILFHKQFVGGIKLNTNGYGLILEWARMKSKRLTTAYQFEFSETKSPGEDKQTAIRSVGGFLIQGNPFIYGKQNYFYQAKFSYGQQMLIGNKGNKNGVSVKGVYSGGLLRPYYLEVEEPGTRVTKTIKYTEGDAANADLFLSPNSINGGAGLGKGWGELKLTPGVQAKAGLRFDYGRFKEVVSALEVGVGLDYYFKKVPITLLNKERNVFFNGYVAILFGKRK
jgi:hypothetical protein